MDRGRAWFFISSIGGKVLIYVLEDYEQNPDHYNLLNTDMKLGLRGEAKNFFFRHGWKFINWAHDKFSWCLAAKHLSIPLMIWQRK